MSSAIPLGRAESVKLEFKGRDSRPIDIAREVVALLNEAGGEIWWGVKEENGKAAAEDPFPEGEGEGRKRDLQNHLIDTIEPSPRIPGEISLELVAARGQGQVMRIQVRPLGSGRAPAAQVKDQGRRYWIRVGDRVRIMSREEVAEKFRAGRGVNDGLEQNLLAAREAVQKAKKPCFWMMIQPNPEVDHQQLNLRDQALRELLTKPAATGNRSSGWTFVLELSQPTPSARGLRHGYDDGQHVEVQRNGAIVFGMPLEMLHWKGGDREIWPYALLEFPVSAVRLAAKLFDRWGPDVSEVLVDFAFVGLRGWSLRRGSPRSPSGRFAIHEFKELDDLVPPKPFRFGREELIQEPDRCGLRLIAFVYEAFGYPEEAIPPEFDQRTGTLVIPPG